MAQKLSDVFSKFIGQEIPLKSVPVKTELLGKTYEDKQFVFEDHDHPVLQEFRKAAEQHGFILRIYPVDTVTRALSSDDLNVTLEQGTDKKWRVAPHMYLG